MRNASEPSVALVLQPEDPVSFRLVRTTPVGALRPSRTVPNWVREAVAPQNVQRPAACSGSAERIHWKTGVMGGVLTDPGFWQAVAVASITVAGAVGATRPALKDLGLKRRLETTSLFEQLVRRANNAGSLGLGLSEQVAAIYLIGTFGRDEKHLRDAARATLLGMGLQFGSGPSADVIREAAESALKLIP